MAGLGGQVDFVRDVNPASKRLYSVPPDRTFCVAQSPPVGLSNPSQWYTTIQAAMDAGAALSGLSLSNPAIVEVYPGTYNQNLAFRSFVHVNGVGPTGSVLLTGPGPGTLQARWSPAQNAYLFLRNLYFDQFEVVDVGIAHIVDYLTCVDCSFYSAFVDNEDTDSQARFFGCECEFLSVGGSKNYLLGSKVNQRLRLGNGAIVYASGSQITTVDTDPPGSTAQFYQDSGSLGNVTMIAGCSADIRGVSQHGVLTGPGAINRDVVNGNTGALAAGAGQVIAIPGPPLKDANYFVGFAQTAGAGVILPTVTAKAANQFTITVGAGGGTYDFSVQHD